MAEQESLIDVYYGGLLISSTLARFTPDELTFNDPEGIVLRIPDLLEPEEVSEALTGAISANQAFLCHHEGQTNCGVLQPESVAIIFDADKFRADIFINPTLLAVRSLDMDKFLPPSDANWSFLQTFNYAFSGNSGDIMENSNLFLLSALSYRENSLRMSANYTNGNIFNIQNLFGQRDWRGKRYQAGYFPTNTQDLRFAPGTNLAGVRLGTSLDTRDDLRLSSGNSIQVFLASRGEVALFKDGRLISSKIYDAGNQTIDTSSLPGGSYNIDIRIRDSGTERVETRFYVKNSFLPPADMPLYFIEVGEITHQGISTTLPTLTGQYLVRGGGNFRLNAANSIIGSLSGTKADTAAEVGWFGLGRGYELRLSGSLAQSSRYGANVDMRFNVFNFFITGSYRRVWDHSGRLFEPMNLIGEEQEQAYLNLSAPTEIGRFSVNARYNDRPLSPPIQSYNLGYEPPAWSTRRGDLRLRFDLGRENELHQALLTLQWRIHWNRWNFTVTPQAVYQEFDDYTESYLRGDANLNWDSQDLWAQNVRTNLRAVKDRDFDSLGADADWRGHYGQARYQIENQHGPAGGQVIQNGNFATNVVVADRGAAFGGRDQNQSAILVDIQGSSDSAALFDVLVNGSRRTSVRGGSRTVVSLRPFETYTVRLKSRGDEFIYLEDREHTVSLYPGNVVHLVWNAAAVDIILGRITAPDSDKPIASALLRGVQGLAVTDDYGLFQAEIERGTRHLRVETRTGQCEIELPDYEAIQGIASVGVLRCHLVAK